MSPKYLIRLAGVEDVPALAEIELAALQLFDGYGLDSVPADNTPLETLAHAALEGHLWVADAGDTPVGFVLVEMLASDLPHLEEIDVHPSHGRRGLGTALVRKACDWATSSGFDSLTLTTFRAIPWNAPFYVRLGFEELSRDTLRPELAALVAAEARRGLDPTIRVVMRYRCTN